MSSKRFRGKTCVHCGGPSDTGERTQIVHRAEAVTRVEIGSLAT